MPELGFYCNSFASASGDHENDTRRPRNGHISIFTKQALTLAWARHGFKTAALNDGTHLAFRTLPKSWGLTALQS